jgi:hypothetical protein
MTMYVSAKRPHLFGTAGTHCAYVKGKPQTDKATIVGNAMRRQESKNVRQSVSELCQTSRTALPHPRVLAKSLTVLLEAGGRRRAISDPRSSSAGAHSRENIAGVRRAKALGIRCGRPRKYELAAAEVAALRAEGYRSVRLAGGLAERRRFTDRDPAPARAAQNVPPSTRIPAVSMAWRRLLPDKPEPL